MTASIFSLSNLLMLTLICSILHTLGVVASHEPWFCSFLEHTLIFSYMIMNFLLDLYEDFNSKCQVFPRSGGYWNLSIPDLKLVMIILERVFTFVASSIERFEHYL